MPVDLRLEIDGLTDERVARLLTFSAGDGTWPILGATTGSSRRGFLFGQYAVRPVLWIPDEVAGVSLFDASDEDGSAPRWIVARESEGRFRATVQLLADELPEGFALRLAWTEDDVAIDVTLDAAGLIDEAEGRGLRRGTRYAVGARGSVNAG